MNGLTKTRLACFRIALMLVIGTSLIGCDSPPHRTQKMQAERQWNQLRSRVKGRLAAEQFDQGRLDDAIATLSEAIQLNPTESAYHRLSARCSLEKGKIAAAVASIRIAASLGDESADIAYLRGMIAERRAQFDDSIEQFSRAWSLDSNNVDHLIALAESLVASGRPTDATELLEAHAQEFDLDPKILLLRAHTYTTLNEAELAAADFAVLMEQLPDPKQILAPYGQVLTRLGRFTEARTLLQRALPRLAAPRREASFASTSRALARCYIETGAPSLALDLLSDHLRLTPNDARAWWLLAETNVALGDLDAAARAMQRGQRLRPDLPHWGLLSAYIALRADDMQTAAATLETVVADHPNNALAHSFLGTLQNVRR